MKQWRGGGVSVAMVGSLADVKGNPTLPQGSEPMLSGSNVVRLMRKHHKTIAGLAAAMNITQTRVRYVMKNGVKGREFVRDWIEWLTADNVKGNPAMATAKQIAWRKKFAAMAKAGTLTKKRRTRKANPLTRVRVNSPSMATGDAPSKRLVKRRKKTAKAPAGYYANPRGGFKVEVKTTGGRFRCVATFGKSGEAESYARALHRANPSRTIRVSK